MRNSPSYRKAKRGFKKSADKRNTKLPRNINPVEVTIERIGSAGDGIGTAELTLNYQTKTYTCFIPNTLAGETVIAKPVSISHQGIVAELVELVDASPARKPPLCPVAFECGGCQLQHLTPAAYQQFKEEKLLATLEQKKLTPQQIIPAFWADEASRRRAKINFKNTASGLILGFFARRSHHIISIEGCIILDPALKAVCDRITNWLAPCLEAGQQGQIHINMLDEGADILLGSDQPWTSFQHTQLAQTAHHIDVARISLADLPQESNHFETPTLLWQRLAPHLNSLGLPVTPPAGGFLQSVKDAEHAMQQHIWKALASSKQVIDLFCGCGTFSAGLLKMKKTVWAVDGDAAACSAYQDAAQQSGYGSTLKVTSRNLFEAPVRSPEMAGFDAAIIDPPRAGAAAQIPHVIGSDVDVVVMVSCNPHSLAKDLALLVEGGFQLDSIMLVDQFVWSTHCEAVAVLKRIAS